MDRMSGINEFAEERASFCDEFYPTRLNELAVHKTKVNELKKWLEQVKNGTAEQAFGILTGPAGTGQFCCFNRFPGIVARLSVKMGPAAMQVTILLS